MLDFRGIIRKHRSKCKCNRTKNNTDKEFYTLKKYYCLT